jgi:hypothetical protein
LVVILTAGWLEKSPLMRRTPASPNFARLFELPTCDLGRGIIGINQHGKTGQALLLGFHHGTSMIFGMDHIDPV